jgi:HK97 gp10 family phage protein
MDVTLSPPIKEVLAAVHGLERALQGKAVRSALVAAIKPVKAEMRSLVPRGSTGRLARSIGHRSLSKSAAARVGISGDGAAILVGSTRIVDGLRQGKKALWQEFGTSKMTPNMFLGPALERHQAGIEPRFYEGLRRYLDKVRQ